MAIKIGSNFAYNSKLPNFERDSFETKAAMKAFDENSIDEGHLSYCKEDGNIYQYKSANTADATTGRWRMFKTEADAALNGTSTNAIQNKAVFDALKAKADAVALDKYQPKYKADYIAKEDLSELPITKGILDLNGHSINASFSNHNDGELTIQNGTILKIGEINAALNIINCTIKSDYVRALDHCPITFNNSSIERLTTADYIYCRIFNSNINHLDCDCERIEIYNSFVNILSCHSDGYNNVAISNSYISIITYDPDSQVINDGLIYLYNCVFETLDLDSYPRSIDVQLCSCCDYANDVTFVNGYYDKTYGLRETAYATEINKGGDLAPSVDAVYNALQLKADKTQLNDLATKTELNSKADKTQLNNYVTTATANTTYAKKTDITNIYKFKGTKTNYSDLPTTDRVIGDVWNITNADAEHGIKAGDNVAWNGTVWDNLSGTVDLSAYATKEKAFTKDTASTEPGQFVAGPATTQGNLYLRKLIADDIPDLKSKYQKLDSNGYQEKAKVAGLIVKHGNTGNTGSGYLIAEIDQAVGGQMGPDWYYATDGTLQDIKTKIPKVTLDDAVSTTSDNGVKNSVITQYVDGKVTTINSSIADLHSSLESTQTDFVDLRNKVNAMPKTVFITQAAYNALTTKDPNTIYYING